ncbi:hypothetical protein TIFTF001_031900 [Ficus carica]|uniref:Reverse transcriptase zinc-binding domain-containing protein n=1 Tax=Ficus carica TaxID=3494 RepID=A0AA88DVH4_FICCA|nr:hypothetical protein TIFTF001_031900 [Ficus carica]
MWNLSIPPKVKLFVWRAFHEILPTMVSLISGGIECDDVCPRCKDEMESTSHAIFDCPTSQAVWRMSRFWKVIKNRRVFPFADFLRSVKSEIPMEDSYGGFCSGVLVSLEIVALNRVPAQLQGVGSDVWSPPQSGYLKLNVDASVLPDMDHIGIALREGLFFAMELKLGTLVVETDAINVVSAVEDNRELSVEGPILEDVKQLLVQLQSTSDYHICRSANHVAHLLARFGFNSNCTNVWISETPIIVSDVISFDAIA